MGKYGKITEALAAAGRRAEMLEAKPSQPREPETSCSVISRFKPEETMAEVSPIVSAAETRKMMQTEKIAPGWKTGRKGRRCGSERRPPEKIPLKSTIPMTADRI